MSVLTINPETESRDATRRQVVTYLTATYLGALALALVFPHREIGALLTIVVPVLATVTAITLTTPRGTRRAVWSTIGLKRAGFRTMPFALLGPAAVTVLSFGIAWATGVVDFPAAGPGAGDEAMNVLVAVVIFTFVLLGEEVGWRGYLQPRLQRILTLRRAVVVTGACHAAFHLPLLLLTTTYQSDGSRWVVVPTVLVTLTLAGVWYGWVRTRSASLWPVTLSHSAFNAFMESGASVAVAGSASTMAYVTTETGLVTLAVMVVLSWYLPLAARRFVVPAFDQGAAMTTTLAAVVDRSLRAPELRPVRLRTGQDLDVVLEEIEWGLASFVTVVRVDRVDATLTNGGVCATLLDLALGAAVQSTLRAPAEYRILEFRMSSCRTQEPLRGRVEARAIVNRTGPRVVSASARVQDDLGSTRAIGSLVALTPR